MLYIEDVDREDVRVRENEVGGGDGAWYCMMETVIVTEIRASEHFNHFGRSIDFWKGLL